MKNKTLKEIEFELITDVSFNNSGYKRFTRRRAVFTFILRKEAIKIYKEEKNQQVKDFILNFFNLNEELINDEKKLIAFQSCKDSVDQLVKDAMTIGKSKVSKDVKIKLDRMRKWLDEIPDDEV